MLRVASGWDLATTSSNSISFSVAGQDSFPTGVTFKPDGTKMYMIGFSNKRVHQYTLSTAWSLSTASSDSVSFYAGSQEASCMSVTFKPDGTKMYLTGGRSDAVYQYTLSTAWDLSTVSYDSVSLDVSGEDGYPAGLTFRPDGKKMYIVDSSDAVHQYTLSTGWSLSTASYDSVSLDVSGEDSAPQGLAFRPDGKKMYIVGSSSDSVHEYVLS